MIINSSVVIKGGINIGKPSVSSVSGSFLFDGGENCNIVIPNDEDFRFRTGDFTVEWWQFQTDNNSYVRPWSQGDWPSATIGVSLEDGLFYYWEDGDLYNIGLIEYKNQWVHFAITRNESTIKVFKNGIQLGDSLTSSYDYNDTINNLGIGNEPTYPYGSLTAFGGNITNFRWVKGTAIYTSNFSVPTSPLIATPDTKLLLLASTEATFLNDSSGLSKTIINTNSVWSSDNPF